MYIPDVGFTTANASTLPQLQGPEGILGKADFLQLLVTQLENQNPFEPMKSYEFTAQLAQFSSLELLQNLNNSAYSALILQQSTNNALAMNVIGKEVRAIGYALELSSGSPVDIHYRLADDADVTIRIYNEQGKLVRSIEMGVRSAGASMATWDGKSSSGDDLPDGIYTYEIAATSPTGVSVEAVGFLSGRVSGVKFSGGQVFLSIGDLEIALSDVVEVVEIDESD